MAKRFKSDAFEAIHSAASGLHRIGVVQNATMRQFDEGCLDLPEDGPQQSDSNSGDRAKSGK